jgi:hypothetical protein
VRTVQSYPVRRWLENVHKIGRDTGGKGYTRAVERQGSDRGGIFGALGQCTSIEIGVMRRAQDKDALAGM